jgi:uncharacterized damage-inducible protein DinB
MSEISRIVDEFAREHDGEPWHGSSLTAILAGVSASDAAAHPIAGAHSIWEIVLHVTAWKNEARRRLSGAPAAEPEEGDWPQVGDVSAGQWTETRDRLDRAQKDLVTAVRQLPEARLFEPNDRRGPQSSDVIHYVLLHGAIQHDAYHAGQIAVLKKGLPAG